jgi:triacylglycerol esterase/lipase EstA (alpha/beta hydrolase family)
LHGAEELAQEGFLNIMQPREVKQYNDAKKASDSSNRSDVGKKCQTHEDRCNYYNRFLKPLKSLALGTMMLTAGMSGTEARLEPALQRKGHDKTTGLTPAFNQTEFNNLSHPTALEFNPNKVTPELLEYLGKFVKNPEKFVQNFQKRDFIKNIQKQDQRQMMRRLVEKARENPEVLESLRTLFEDMPGKESSKTDRITLDKETERLTPDKIDPEVWINVRKMLTEKTPISDQQGNAARRELAVPAVKPTVILVHGITGWANGAGLGPWTYNSSAGSNCNDNYWGTTIKYLKDRGYSNTRTVKFFTGDTNCDVDLHKSAYQDKCNSFSRGSEGTNNEDLNHVSCLLAQYLNQNFAGEKVILVGHSMGGIIIRNTMYQVQEYGGKFGMPSDIGHVTDAVTFNTPHAGVGTALSSKATCGGCTQINQLAEGSTLMSDLSGSGQNPQTSAGFTQWTVVGSECDPVVNAPSNPDGAAGAIAMQARHAIMYTHGGSPDDCYDHTRALGDDSTKNDATLYYCDATTVLGCGTNYKDSKGNAVPGWTRTTSGSHGLQTLYEAVRR